LNVELMPVITPNQIRKKIAEGQYSSLDSLKKDLFSAFCLEHNPHRGCIFEQSLAKGSPQQHDMVTNFISVLKTFGEEDTLMNKKERWK